PGEGVLATPGAGDEDVHPALLLAADGDARHAAPAAHEDFPRDGAGPRPDLLDPGPARTEHDHRIAERRGAGADVEGHEVHRDAPDDRDTPAAQGHLAAVRERPGDSVRIAEGERRDPGGACGAPGAAVADGVAGADLAQVHDAR